jgi:hypothetical protein
MPDTLGDAVGKAAAAPGSDAADLAGQVLRMADRAVR